MRASERRERDAKFNWEVARRRRALGHTKGDLRDHLWLDHGVGLTTTSNDSYNELKVKHDAIHGRFS